MYYCYNVQDFEQGIQSYLYYAIGFTVMRPFVFTTINTLERADYAFEMFRVSGT